MIDRKTHLIALNQLSSISLLKSAWQNVCSSLWKYTRGDKSQVYCRFCVAAFAYLVWAVSVNLAGYLSCPPGVSIGMSGWTYNAVFVSHWLCWTREPFYFPHKSRIAIYQSKFLRSTFTIFRLFIYIIFPSSIYFFKETHTCALYQVHVQ